MTRVDHLHHVCCASIMAAAWVSAPVPTAWSATPLGTAFTYQGQLKQNGNRVDDTCDCRFSLWDDPTGGAQVGPTLTLDGQPGNPPPLVVTDGMISVPLDFGGGAFDGERRWLQIDLACPSGDPLQPLSPRQELTMSPYALFALDGPGSGGGFWAASGSDIYNTNAGRVGIGIASPERVLHTVGGAVLFERASNDAGVILRNTSNGEINALFGLRSTGPDDGFTLLTDQNFSVTMALRNASVGIGTTSPTARLHAIHSATTGVATGVLGQSASTIGRGVVGHATAASGGTFGVIGQSDSPAGTGVIGYALASAGATIGVLGSSSSPDGYGGYFSGRGYFSGKVGIGEASPAAKLEVRQTELGDILNLYHDNTNVLTVTNGGNVGIGTATPADRLAVITGDSGTAIVGRCTRPTGGTAGVRGFSESVDGAGVHGEAVTTTGANSGIKGLSFSTEGQGVTGIATPTTGSTSGVYGLSLSASGRGVTGEASSESGTNYGVYGRALSTNGYDFFAAGPGEDYGSLSSIRWKRNIKPIDRPLDRVARLRGVHFDWDDEHGGHHDVGMIAEEVGKVLPEIVNYEENGIDANGMDYSKLTPLLVEAVKELRHALDDRDAEIAELRSEMNALKAQMGRVAPLRTP